MSLRDDAILLCGFIYGVDRSIPTAIRNAINRINEVNIGIPCTSNEEKKTDIKIKNILTDDIIKIKSLPKPISKKPLNDTESRQNTPPDPPPSESKAPTNYVSQPHLDDDLKAYISTPKDGALIDNDWPEIKKMMNRGVSNLRMCIHFRVEEYMLKRFIECMNKYKGE